MAKTDARVRNLSTRTATKAFERAWKLLGQLEKDVASARDEEAKRRRQLLTATGPDVARRQAQLDLAMWRAGEGAALLTELSELIADNARAQARQTVRDVAHEAAQAVRAEEQAKTAAALQAPLKPVVRPRARPAAKAPPKPAAKAPAKPVARPSAKPAAQAAAEPPNAPVASTASTGTSKPPSATAARRSQRTPRTGTAAKPRARRSLQPGKPDPGESTS